MNYIKCVNSIVQIYTFNIIHYTFTERLRLSYKECQMSVFYWVPNFEGLFIENHFACLRRVVKKWIGEQYNRMEQNNNIFYVNQSHAKTATQNYNYHLIDNGVKFTDISKLFSPFDESVVRERYIKYKYNIIAIARFSFPHKGFILGLIDSYTELKKEYKELKLYLIGYGPDAKDVYEKINDIENESIKKDIYVLGKIPYSRLAYYFDKSFVNIGVASTIVDGAGRGLISIPVRHYTKTCEGYGFLPESKDFTTSSHKSTPIEYYLKFLFGLSLDNYIELSKNAHSTYYIEESEVDKRVLNELNDRNIKQIKSTTNSFYIFIYCYNILRGIIKKIKSFFKNAKK